VYLSIVTNYSCLRESVCGRGNWPIDIVQIEWWNASESLYVARVVGINRTDVTLVPYFVRESCNK